MNTLDRYLEHGKRRNLRKTRKATERIAANTSQTADGAAYQAGFAAGWKAALATQS